MAENNRHYIFNLETTKIELHFEKSEYNAMTDEQKRELKGAFLFSGKGKCWVSRAKEPNLWRAKQVAEKLGFTGEQREGERLTYGEQLDRQAERAEARADRYEGYAENAAKRGEQLQKPLNSFHGDISFFTQPNINSSAGRAFTNYRNRLYARYESGFKEYRKSEYFKDRAETARGTASQAQFSDPAYLDRRIKECQKEVRAREKNIIHYEKILQAVENGEQKKWRGGEVVTVEEVNALIGRELELAEKAMDKQGYLENCLDDLGGRRFSKDNVKPGYIVDIGRYGPVEVLSTGPVNLVYKILTGGAAGMGGTAAYAEIKDIIKAEEKKPDIHPFTVGEQFKAIRRDYPDDTMRPVTTEIVYEIVKASDTTIQLKAAGTDEKPITRKPVKTYSGQWRFSIDDSYGNTFTKLAPAVEGAERGGPPAKESASVMDKLAAAKETVAKGGEAKTDRPEPKKSHGAEL